MNDIKKFFEGLKPVEDLDYKKELLELHNEIEDSLLEGPLNESSSLYIYTENRKIVDYYFDDQIMNALKVKEYERYELFIEDKDKCIEFKATEFVWWLYKYIIGLPSIQELRETLRITRKTAAAFLMIPSRSFENWEYGRSTPPLYVERYIFNTLLDRISRICNLDILQLNKYGFDLDKMELWSDRLNLMSVQDIEEFQEEESSFFNDEDEY
jgi:hypothetical protein